jgi:hypothetical protein
MRQALALLTMLTVLAAPTHAETPADQEILGFRLGQSAPELSEARNLQDLLGAEIARDMTGLMVVEQPNPRYQIALKYSRRLTLWFDASKKERPIYWIELRQSYDPPPVPPDQYDRILDDLGQPDYDIAGRQGTPLGSLLIKIDPSLSQERSAATRRHIDTVIANRPDPSSSDDLFIEPGGTLKSWLEILGKDFRGKLVGIYTISNRIDGTAIVLIDTAAARAAQFQTAQ